MPPSSPQPVFEFDCPLCGGAFEADRALLGQPVECPHCGKVVELPAGETAILSSSAGQTGEEPLAAGMGHSEDPASESSGGKTKGQGVLPKEPQRSKAREKKEGRAAASRTREQLAVARRRLNFVLAAVGGLLLIITFVVLASLN